MRKRFVGISLALGCIAIGAGGCAKQQTVKGDEPLATSSVVAREPAGNVESNQPKLVKAENVAEEPAPGSASVAEEILAPIPQAGALQPSLQKIYFDFDSPALSEEGREVLAKNAEIMKSDPAMRVQIEGHCDERGSDEYNLALGDKRAHAAMRYLSAMGIPADRLSVISYGKEKPADSGHDEAAWSRNRRDEFIPQR